MAICPKCKKEIEGLKADLLQHTYHDVWIDGDELNYQWDDNGDAIETSFHCPKCDAELFQEEDDAENFLKSIIN